MPENVLNDFKSIEDSLRSKIESYNSDYLKEVISIVAKNVRKKEKDDYSKEDPENEAALLNMEYLNKLVPSGGKYLLQLIDIKVIIRSSNYIPGKQSFKYNFTPAYKSKYIQLPLYNAKLIRKIKSRQEQKRKKDAISIRGLTKQVIFLKQLTFDPSVYDYIEANYKKGTNKYNRIISAVTRIENGDIFYSRDVTSYRFHSNLTIMPEGIRKYLRYKGQPLVNLDVKNCQFYLSIMLLTEPVKLANLTKYPVFAMILKSLKVSRKQDVIKYISLNVNGVFYDDLMIEFNKEGMNLNRDQTKKKVIAILFSPNPMPVNPRNKKCKEIFKKCYPTVFTIFNKVRGSESEKRDHFQDFRRFVILLQTIESYLILDVILKRIYRELPGVVALSIHDSIMTTEANVEAIHKIMKDELSKFVGYEPTIKME